MKNKLHKLLERHWHTMFASGHGMYFGMVFIEGHSIYALIAGLLAAMVAVGAYLHLGE